MILHGDEVRYVRTFVNPMEYVRSNCDKAAMQSERNAGIALLALKERAGRSFPKGSIPLEEIAKRSDYSSKTSIQAYFNERYEGPLSIKAARKLAKGLAGLGSPAITEEEVIALAGDIPAGNASEPFKYEGSSLYRMPRDLPIYGAALGAERLVDGEAIELTTLNRAEVIEHRERPPILNGKPGVYGLFVQGSSMDPAFDDGDLLVVQKTGAISSGDFVVVYLRPKDESDDGETATNVLVKRLIRRTAQFIELRQYQPDLTFKIPTADILRVDKALRTKDLLG